MKKISAFLAELDPWGIYDAANLADAFRRETGQEPTWGTYSAKQTKKMMRDRGLGGTLTVSHPKQQMAYGYSVAISLASSLVPAYRCTKTGRGFAFIEALNALRGAGL